MFESDDLEEILNTSHAIENEQAVVVEWNLNQFDNIERVGNYRYRPGTVDPNYGQITSAYQAEDPVNESAGFKGYYTGATDSDIALNAGIDDSNDAAFFIAPKRKMNLLYSLEDCLKENRPRSGINKLLYLGTAGASTGYNQYIDSLNNFRSTKEYPITNATFSVLYRINNQLVQDYDPLLHPNPEQVPVIVYDCVNDFAVGDAIKVQGIVVNGSARVTIDFDDLIPDDTGQITTGSAVSIYEGQEVTSPAPEFPAGTYIASISGNTIVFSEDALIEFTNQTITFSGTNSDFNFTTPKKIVWVSDTQFMVQTNTSENIAYYSGGTAIFGYTSTVNVARRPRYYMSSRYDQFKYWTSYRTESTITETSATTEEFGISRLSSGSETYWIYDAAPFVVYKNKIPANRIVIKMQTNVGDIDLGPFRIGDNANVPDPLYGRSNMSIPKTWSVEVLKGNTWSPAIAFDADSARQDGSPIIGTDGYVELEYGLDIPVGFERVFILVDEITSLSQRPDTAPYGYAYLLRNTQNERGTVYVSDGESWAIYPASYSWKVADQQVTRSTSFVSNLVNPKYHVNAGTDVYEEFEMIRGIRIVVSTMNKPNATFDLIEVSPRLVANITDKTVSFSIRKTLSDLANYSMPTGSLLAATGSIDIFDEEFAFNENNTFNETTKTGSIIANFVDSKAKFSFYDVVRSGNSYDYYIPIKSLYSEGFPQVSDSAASVSIQLRDLFYFLEQKKAPEMLLTDVSLSYAIMVMLDSIGFSNYVFKKTDLDEELIIPFFFVPPEKNVAQVLQDLAISSQSAIFFDEYNNLVVMSKNYLLPAESDREVNKALYGQEMILSSSGEKYPYLGTIYDVAELPPVELNGAFLETSSGKVYVWDSIGSEWVEEGDKVSIILPNIMSISAKDKRVYNGGEIIYTTRYIQRCLLNASQ